jgi:hypothetical protein
VPFCDNYFIVKANNFYQILDMNLQIVVDNCEDILFYKDMIAIKRIGKYSIYKIKQ